MKDDAFSAYDPLLAHAAATRAGSPWTHQQGQAPTYSPDDDLLAQLLSVSVGAGNVSESGRFAKAIDAWLAHELRRAGFGADEVWPRATRPRVLSADLAVLLDKLPKKISDDLARRITTMPAIAPSDARVLGRAYDKQVDVCIARWQRGPELMLSTKAQVSSFAKNLPNRFEEAYGDASNLRGRHPLAATGFFFLQRDTILRDEPGAFERTVDMIRKLRESGGHGGYTATALALVHWDDPPTHSDPDPNFDPDRDPSEDPSPEAAAATAGGQPTVSINDQAVPDDINAAQFLAAMIDQVLRASPITHHVRVRELREQRTLALPTPTGTTDEVQASEVEVDEGDEGDGVDDTNDSATPHR